MRSQLFDEAPHYAWAAERAVIKREAGHRVKLAVSQLLRRLWGEPHCSECAAALRDADHDYAIAKGWPECGPIRCSACFHRDL